MIIRPICENDAEAFVALCQRLDNQSEYMLLESGERSTTVDEQRKIIRTALSRGNQMIFVAEMDAALIGFLALMGGQFRRNRHCASVVVGVLQEFTGRGAATMLFKSAEQWARAHAIKRLELTVMVHNQPALRLYKKIGFQTEGTRSGSIHLNDLDIDEYYMAKIL